MNKPTNLILANAILKRFYSLAFPEKKARAALWKKVRRFEDVSYLFDSLDDGAKSRLEDDYRNAKESEVNAFVKLREDLVFFRQNSLAKDKEIDFSALKPLLISFDSRCKEAASSARFGLLTPLYDFGANLKVALEHHQEKLRGNLYVDLDEFEKEIDGIFLAPLSSLDEAIQDYGDNEDYLSRHLSFIRLCHDTLWAAKDNGPFRVPEWGKGLLFCAPWIIGFLIFTLYPLIQTIIFSFSNVNLTTEGFQSVFVGWNNYVNIFTSDTDFILALKNYLVTMVVYVPLVTIFSLGLAMLLNSNVRGKGFFRVIFFFPVIITSGPVMKILIEQGVTAMPGLNAIVNFKAMEDSMPELLRMAMNILTGEFVMILWFSGIQILVFLTALQKIDKSVYEASAIDGANRWEQFWKVTLPAINSSIVINVVFTTVMQSIFALNPIILKIQADMNDTSEGKGYGYSSALAFSYFLVMIIVLGIFVFLFKRHGQKRKEAKR